MIKIQSLIEDKKVELHKLIQLHTDFPNIEIHYGPLGMVYCDESIGKKADTLEQFIPNRKFGFSFTTLTGIKLYAKPYSVEVKSSTGYEYDWLSDCLLINPKLIVEIMVMVESKFLRRIDEYQRRFTYLTEWLVRYDPNNYYLNSFINRDVIEKIKQKLELEKSTQQ